ncbi:hypothetical protein GCM10010413_20250 [Promicromonospora sukumoe]
MYVSASTRTGVTAAAAAGAVRVVPAAVAGRANTPATSERRATPASPRHPFLCLRESPTVVRVAGVITKRSHANLEFRTAGWERIHDARSAQC